MNRNSKHFLLAGGTATFIFIILKMIANYCSENSSIDDNNPYLSTENPKNGRLTKYELVIKPILDQLLSFSGLVILSPLYGLISLAVYFDDPGPIFFAQKRIGKDKHFFMLHKYRSMKISTPHDIPTHMLSNPEKYITRVGNILRKTSLDELPQIWDIFRGKMSIIGPRPALWNQCDLVECREKYDANSITPGLTGLAQIKGRDKLEISDKAIVDGKYTTVLRQGGLNAFWQDMTCFIESIGSVFRQDGIVEGGTGLLHNLNTIREKSDNFNNAGFEDYAYLKAFNINKNSTNKKKVLITGVGSYIGESFVKYALDHYPDNFVIDTIDLFDKTWKKYDFSSYDAIFHVAGIAHSDIGKISKEKKEKYYTVNTKLAIDTAQKAKDAGGSKQFIFISSMVIYGNSAPYGKKKEINEKTIPLPDNFYGDSKWQADKEIRKLADENFHTAVLRLPMIYGKESKGNYPILAKIAKRSLLFPNIENQRSMLYINNLCEFLCLLMLSGEGGVYFPQNKEYTMTTNMVRQIAKASNKHIHIIKIPTSIIKFTSILPGKIGELVNKAFGNFVYEQKLSQYQGLDYRVADFEESIKETEGTDILSIMDNTIKTTKCVLIIASVASMIDQFNIPNIKLLINLGFGVDVATNFISGSTCTKQKIQKLLKLLDDMKVDCYQIDFNRNFIDLTSNVKAFRQLDRVVKGDANPINKRHYHNISYTHQYAFIHSHSPIGGAIGRIVAKKHGIKTIYTAHGFHFYDGAPIKNWLLTYPVERELSWITDVLITINKEDYKRAKKQFHAKRTVYIPGVGVDTKKFDSGLIDPEKKRKELGIKSDEILLLSVGELIPRKNHAVVVKALAKISNPKIKYIIAGKGPLESALKSLTHKLKIDEQVEFLGFRTDVSELCQAADIFIFPSHQEGLPVALMEAIACGIPAICSNIRGNTDLITDKCCLFDENSVDDVIQCLNRLITDRSNIKLSNKRRVELNKTILSKYNLSAVEKRMETEFQKLGSISP